MLRSIIVISALALAALSACSGVQHKETTSFESFLSRAGFQMQVADTPEKLAQITNVPQHKFLKQDHEGKPLYLYADAEGCKCLYAGSQQAYDKFQTLVSEGDEANELAEASALEPASTDADWVDVPSFGEWQPWY